MEFNTHICKEYTKSKKHKGYKKDNIIEVLVTEKIKNILNGIINIHHGRIIKLNKEKEKRKRKRNYSIKNKTIKKKRKTKKKIR